MSTNTEAPAAGGEREPLDLDDPRLSRFEKVREGARRDGIEIVHYEPQFPVPGTRAERRLIRLVAGLFLLMGLAATAFLVIYIWWPWRYGAGGLEHLYTPLLGGTLGLTLLALGLGIIAWGRKLLPKEVSVQDRHDGGSPREDRTLAGETMLYMADELGVRRRPLLGLALLAGLAPVGALAVVPLVGGLVKQPHEGNQMFTTGWSPQNGVPVRLTREDGTPLRPEDVSAGGQLTVFPGIPGGATNEHADSPTLLIHLREQDAELARRNNEAAGKRDYMWGNYIAYSKICTHAGCPASLYEQQTNRLLCPCHQSQFLITENARPLFGPASRRLPQLPLELDSEGFFVARSDYTETVGPDFWERP
jgi:ubiquinol-cytochrome c reductase iron-sulfur subunit